MPPKVEEDDYEEEDEEEDDDDEDYEDEDDGEDDEEDDEDDEDEDEEDEEDEDDEEEEDGEEEEAAAPAAAAAGPGASGGNNGSTAPLGAAAASNAQDAAGEEEDEDEEEEEEDEDAPAQPWEGLKRLPERQEVVELIRELVQAGRKQLTILLLGKGGAGKSSTLNSILGEQVARVSAFKLQPDTEMTTSVVRQVQLGTPDSQDVDGFKIKIIDTCGLEDPEAGDTVHYLALQRIAEDLRGQSVDCVMFVDRLDLYRVEALDQNIVSGISDMLGRGVWKKTLLTLTHSNLQQPPPGTTYDSFVNRRIAGLRRAVRGGLFRPSLPAALVENSESCPTGQRGKRVLPDQTEWLVDLFTAATDMALSSAPYKYKPHMTQNPNRRFRWLIPAVIGLQYLLWKQLIVPVIERDLKVQGDLEEKVWAEKAAIRKKWGTHRPLRPSKERAWRLEQIYDDE